MSCNGDCGSCLQGFSRNTATYGEVDLTGIEKQINEFEYNPEIHSRPSVVFLGVTARCNLACKYCFVKQHNTDMSLETAENAVKIALKNGEAKGRKPDIIFFGGEPLLMYDEIIVPIMEKYGDRASFTFTTNATLLDEDKVDFFYKHGCTPLISLDGIKEVQDTQRPGKGFSSFDAVLNNIPYILFRFPNITMRATVSKQFIPRMYEGYLMGKELGFKNFSFCINAFDEWDEQDANNYKEQLNKIGEDIYRNCFKGEICTESTLCSIYSDISDTIFNRAKFNNEVMKCGMGTTTFSVTPDGLIVPCQEKVSNPTWVLGDVNNGGFDEKKHKEFLEWYIERMNHLSCPNNCDNFIRRYCLQRQCSSRLEDLDFKLSSSICAQSKIQAKFGNRLWHLVHDSLLPEVRAAFTIGGWE